MTKTILKHIRQTGGELNEKISKKNIVSCFDLCVTYLAYLNFF